MAYWGFPEGTWLFDDKCASLGSWTTATLLSNERYISVRKSIASLAISAVTIFEKCSLANAIEVLIIVSKTRFVGNIFVSSEVQYPISSLQLLHLIPD